MIEFSDQAWEVFSADAENDGVVSQYIIYFIEKFRKEASVQSDSGEEVSQIGNVAISWEISSGRIIIKSIVNADSIISERAARGDKEKYLSVLSRVPDVNPVDGDETRLELL